MVANRKPDVVVLATREYPHGTRARYNAQKCRCSDCRRANTAYESQRQRDPRIPADAVRAHLAALNAANVGRRQIADAADISPNVVSRIASGQPRIRRSVAQAILSVDADAIADGALVPARPTRDRLRALLREGYRKAYLAERLGSGIPYLRGDHVLASTALRVRKLHDELMAEGEDLPVEAESPRVRILAALRRFDWIGAESLFDAMGVVPDDRRRYVKALSRLGIEGAIERREDGEHLYEYRSLK